MGYHHEKLNSATILDLSKAQIMAQEHQRKMETKVADQLAILKSAVREYNEATWFDRTEMRQVTQLEHTSNIIIETMEVTRARYANTFISKAEIMEMVTKMKLNYNTPELTVEQWQSIMNIHTLIDNGNLTFHVDLPLIDSEEWKIIKVIATPIGSRVLLFKPI